jgi:hypothetical protein
MNLVALDPSIISTAVNVNGKMLNYCRESTAYGKTGMSKWFKLCEQHIDYKFINLRRYESYSEGELIKMSDYDLVTNQIISDILDNINPNEETKVAIEGYSFGSEAGDLIDLVTFGTLLRRKIMERVSADLLVISPLSLKLEACKLTYQPIDVGKKKPKLEWRNNEGTSGGKFTKTDMFKAIIENNNFTDSYSTFLKTISGDVLCNKDIKKPLEDCNDAHLLYLHLKSIHNVK